VFANLKNYNLYLYPIQQKHEENTFYNLVVVAPISEESVRQDPYCKKS